jgi:hypothetical protein
MTESAVYLYGKMDVCMAPEENQQDYVKASNFYLGHNHSPDGESVVSDGSSRLDDEGAIQGQAKPALLRLPELVDVLAKEGQVLRWDENLNWYEVLDGPLFEEKFNSLRCTREKRKEQAADRPFARYQPVTSTRRLFSLTVTCPRRMHNYYVLVRGGRWAGTGSAFRPVFKHATRAHPTLTEDALNPALAIRAQVAESCAGSPDRWTPGPPGELAPSQPPFWTPAPANTEPAGAAGFTADSDDAASGGGGRAAPLRLPALIQAIAAEGRAVRWDAAARWYEVINGPLFEER